VNVALDTNILIDLWANTAQGVKNAATLNALTNAGDTLSICGAVRAELDAHPTMTGAQIDSTLTKMNIQVDWTMTKDIWTDVGRAHKAATARRQNTQAKQGIIVPPRRPLADHIIGAHAQHRADALLTLNVRDFSDFPALKVLPA